MEQLWELLDKILDGGLIRLVISGPKKQENIQKIKVRPIEKKGVLLFQIESFTSTQVFHENLDASQARDKILEYAGGFRQIQAETTGETVTVLISRKGKVTVKSRKRMVKAATPSHAHDRKKRSLIGERGPVPFLQDLGVMTGDGKIVRAKADKFRQINRFLEYIEDILPRLDRDRKLTVVDFGCGKSYFTFAMYHYLHECLGYDIQITGLDLKEEVIDHCCALAEKYGYDGLKFQKGDIAEYEETGDVDMVVTLHACDTATDYAIAKAVTWNAKIILCVPCCQHELNTQMGKGEIPGQNREQVWEFLAPIMEYGLLKERFAALVTDGLRAKYLEAVGYETQVLEFIEMEHTPKNILLRAMKKRGENEKAREDIRRCETFLGVRPALGTLFRTK